MNRNLPTDDPDCHLHITRKDGEIERIEKETVIARNGTIKIGKITGYYAKLSIIQILHEKPNDC